jgi:SAM-dependent methyltransferase
MRAETLDTKELRGVEDLGSLDKALLRIGNPDWGSKLVKCTNGDVRLHGSGNSWSYSAEIEISDILKEYPGSNNYYVKITMTILKGEVAIGILSENESFTSEYGPFPRNQKVVIPVPLSAGDRHATLMIRNGAQPNSVIRIHDITLERFKEGKIAGSASSSPALDQKNVDFWSQLCGSKQAQQIGVTDFSPRSLKKFDDWYFNFYPYLFLHIPFTEMADLDVLEIGLGYGTVSQRLAEWGARYTGLDITPGAADLVNRRLRQAGLAGEARVGSILDAPFANESFDRIVSIGCLHHTGNLAMGINECWRMLRPGGHLILMVYNAYSLRRWVQARRATAKLWLRERLGYRGVLASLPGERTSYDTNAAGEEAPHLDLVSVTSLRHMCSRFTDFSYTRENIDQEPPFALRSRNQLLKTYWPRMGGTDIYVTAKKSMWYLYGK